MWVMIDGKLKECEPYWDALSELHNAMSYKKKIKQTVVKGNYSGVGYPWKPIPLSCICNNLPKQRR